MYGLCTKMFPNLFQHQRKGGILVQPRSFIGRLGVFVISLWWYWFIQSHLLDSKLQPIHHHYDVAKQHCDHANPKIAFHFAYPATRNLSQHGHRNHGKEDTIINTARKRSWDCHKKNKDSGKFQQFIWLYPEIIRKKTVFCPFSVCRGVSLHLRQCMPRWRTFACHQMFPVMGSPSSSSIQNAARVPQDHLNSVCPMGANNAGPEPLRSVAPAHVAP